MLLPRNVAPFTMRRINPSGCKRPDVPLEGATFRLAVPTLPFHCDPPPYVAESVIAPCADGVKFTGQLEEKVLAFGLPSVQLAAENEPVPPENETVPVGGDFVNDPPPRSATVAVQESAV